MLKNQALGAHPPGAFYARCTSKPACKSLIIMVGMNFPPCEVLANELAAATHAEGQLVLHIRSGRIEVEVCFEQFLYRVYGFSVTASRKKAGIL